MRYAIADVAAVVPAGGAVEQEAWLRGQTVYCPDERISLYPPAIGEGAASLLPDQERPALVYVIELDGHGRQTRRGSTARSCAATGGWPTARPRCRCWSRSARCAWRWPASADRSR